MHLAKTQSSHILFIVKWKNISDLFIDLQYPFSRSVVIMHPLQILSVYVSQTVTPMKLLYVPHDVWQLIPNSVPQLIINPLAGKFYSCFLL